MAARRTLGGALLVLGLAPREWKRGATTEAADVQHGARYLRVDLSYQVTVVAPRPPTCCFIRTRRTEERDERAIKSSNGKTAFALCKGSRAPLSEGMLSDGPSKLRDEYGDPPRHEDRPSKEPKEKDKKHKDSDSPDAGG